MFSLAPPLVSGPKRQGAKTILCKSENGFWGLIFHQSFFFYIEFLLHIHIVFSKNKFCSSFQNTHTESVLCPGHLKS